MQMKIDNKDANQFERSTDDIPRGYLADSKGVHVQDESDLRSIV